MGPWKHTPVSMITVMSQDPSLIRTAAEVVLGWYEGVGIHLTSTPHSTNAPLTDATNVRSFTVTSLMPSTSDAHPAPVFGCRPLPS